MNIVLEIIIFNVVVFTICGINMAKKGRLGLIQEYPKAIQNRCRELGLIEESSGKLMKKATIGKIGFFIGYIVLQTVLAYYIGEHARFSQAGCTVISCGWQKCGLMHWLWTASGFAIARKW